MISTEELLKCAVATAQTAGNFARDNRKRRGEVNLSTRHDMKLQLDRDSQDRAEQTIQKFFPDHAIIGEEGSENGESEYTWVVDPIDGTLNFFHSLPHWCTSVAVKRAGEVLAGCVYAPDYGWTFTGTIDGTPRLNGEAIQASTISSLSDAMVLSGIGKAEDNYQLYANRFSAVIQASQKTRMLGAAAIDLCLVACGRVEAYTEMGLFEWDYAAGGLIAERAGGRFEILHTYPDGRTQILCSNGLVHDKLKAVLEAVEIHQ